MIRSLIVLLLILPFQLLAIDLSPFETVKVSKADWQRYHTEVNSEFGHTSRIHSIQKLITYTDNRNRVSFAFTIKGHSAHPSWITRQVIQNDGRVSVRQIGYFAGNEASFSELYAHYKMLNGQIKNQVINNAE